MLIPVRMVIPRTGNRLGEPRCEYADVPFGEIARAAALAMVESCADPDLRIRLREGYEQANRAGRFGRMEET